MKKIVGMGIFVMSFFAFLVSGKAAPLKIGADAPQIRAMNQDREWVDFASLYQKGFTLVYFYPKADTPGCTAEACSLRDAFVELQEKGIQVIGVSGDRPESQKKFQEKYRLPFSLIADSDGKVMRAFGVPSLFGFSARQSFLIRNGKIVWSDLSASTSKQAQDVLKAIATLK